MEFNDGVIKKGPLRGPNGRFLPKGVEEAPVKKGEKPVPPKPNEEEQLEAALRKDLGEKELGVSTNGVRCIDGEMILNAHDICAYRWFPNRFNRNEKASHAIVIVDKYFKEYDADTRKHYKEFLNYLFNDSPWEACFLTKDVSFAINRYVSFNVEEKRASVVSAQQVMRQFSEFPAFRETYKACRSNKMSVAHSVFVACFFNYEIPGGKFAARPDTGHSCVNKHSVLTEVKRTFKEGILNDMKDKAYKIPTGGLGVICDAVAFAYREHSFYTHFCKLTGKEAEGMGWNAKVPKFSFQEILMAIGMVFG